MAHPLLTLEDVSFILPDGTVLFSGLSEQFDSRRTGLVGRNGIGKSVLAQLLADVLPPSSGRYLRIGTTHYLAQRITPADHDTVADLAGTGAILDALERIEAGGTDTADFATLDGRWDIRQRLERMLAELDLPHLHPRSLASRLSGGEAMRVALAGALLSDADFLILDEPTNHLDILQRQKLAEGLARWPKGLLVISHDRTLLDTMSRTVELSAQGLRSYGGAYSFYQECKTQERDAAVRHLEQCRHERKQEETALREERERLAQRQAKGRRLGQEANQANILLGRQKERSEQSAGKLRQRQEAAREAMARQIREAASRLDEETAIALLAPDSAIAPQQRVVTLDGLVLPFAPAAMQRLSLFLAGPRRVGIVGPNGCGKTTLLKVLAGHLAPLGGVCERHVECAVLDQQLTSLDPSRPVLAQLLDANPRAGEAALRTRLAQLGLGAGAIVRPSGSLSGGERLKAALALALYAAPPARLLLLDEPGNHLDLDALRSLETMLGQFRGALLVVSHDEAFLGRIGLTDRLRATPDGWRLEPWPDRVPE
ncbi:ABC-F family ATP-binding cassette domain-containing protein [Paludibacterium paludis]|uniref:ABC transporter ATP-binding protein n=1 Tax=Paludibacterium paludis TaxID=1225769 RepID=A0A918NXK8_9NEIS|nr:ATP-binding cassette domain-containing protein [Paludibacterium paludis]GGY04488.1 ABC transporter ATP-binding protein [Paludibacterium paludis]